MKHFSTGGSYQVGIRCPHVYTYIICAKYLGRYIRFLSTQTKSCIDIRLTKDKPLIPHLMFVDDCTIFWWWQLHKLQEMSNTSWITTIKYPVN